MEIRMETITVEVIMVLRMVTTIRETSTVTKTEMSTLDQEMELIMVTTILEALVETTTETATEIWSTTINS